MSDTTKKRIITVTAIVLVGYAFISIWGMFGDDMQDALGTRTFMDKDSGELFQVEVKEGVKFFPAKNPSTGEMTLYPTEVCYKNECKDAGGTPVIMNQLVGKSGPTFCPKCGALVSPR
ncbi:MAG: hypothetical protein GXP29_10660 [Planctomycetes bacterium]|nr:hypothetical protein [Planctomycetota bacterium]